MQNTAGLMQEKNIEKVSVPEACLRPCQLFMVNFFAKIVKDFEQFVISERTLLLQQMFDRVLNTSLYTLSNSFILPIK